ncbi:MAG: hypothetical protein EXX96DRAFT_577177 [Benjaminiella poitrasii]|nr:MAG: hypothetical protein EXX96DRAFT_577177 [Benjaminiella poitrasii]
MQSKRTLGDAFILETVEKVISIVAKETGFEGIQAQALDYFTNLINAYFENVLNSAHLLAELGNRARPNIHDITRSLENAGVEVSTFKQYLNTKVNDTQTVRKVNRYFKAQPKESTVEKTPQFLPSDNEDSDDEADDNMTEGGLPTYVPQHLPVFPSKHSFRRTPIYISRPDDPQKVRELNSEQSRTVEENLKKLMSAENDILREKNGESTTEIVDSAMNNITMPIVNYEIFLQRRKRQKQSGTTLNVEGANEPKSNNNNSDDNDNDNDSINNVSNIETDINEFNPDSGKSVKQEASS